MKKLPRKKEGMTPEQQSSVNTFLDETLYPDWEKGDETFIELQEDEEEDEEDGISDDTEDSQRTDDTQQDEIEDDEEFEEDLERHAAHVRTVFQSRYDVLRNDKLYKSLLAAIAAGDTTLAQSVVAQSVKIDADWIDSIENGIFSIEQIIRKPKTFIREDRELVGVERAKRVDGLAVRHLSTHTEYIKEIDKKGGVRPSKIMTRQLEQELAIYENRFVYALIKRLETFVEQRYEAITKSNTVKDNTTLNVSSGFAFGDADVSYNLVLNVKTPSKNVKLTSQNDELLAKLEMIRDRLYRLEGTEFAKVMSAKKPVKPPIMKTNLLVGNVDYRNCYNLWIMLSGFTTLGYCVDIRERSLTFDEDYYDDLRNAIACTIEVMMTNAAIRRSMYSELPFTRKRRKYKVSRKVEYNVARMTKPKDGEYGNELSQFYYDRIRRMAGDIASLSMAYDLEGFETDNVDTSFRRFFKGLQRIDNELYYDMLKMRVKPDADAKSQRTLESVRRELKREENVLKKHKLLVKLKKEELKLTEARQTTQEKRIDKLKDEIKRLEISRNIKDYKMSLKKSVEKVKKKNAKKDNDE